MTRTSLWGFDGDFLWSTHGVAVELFRRLLWRIFFAWGFPQVCGEFSHTFHTAEGVEKGGFLANARGFWCFTQSFPCESVQNLLFPHAFPQPVEKSAGNPRGFLKSRGKVWGETEVFHKRDQKTEGLFSLAALDLLDHFIHFGAENGVLRHALVDGLQGRNDGGMVALDDLTDVGQ